MLKISDADWQNWGAPVPNRNSSIDIKGRIAAGYLLIGVRVVEPIDCDMGISVELSFADRTPITFYNIFGDGVYPACLAEPGEMWVMALPLEAKPVKCQVDQIPLPVKAASYIYK